jgi:hypothetical protein
MSGEKRYFTNPAIREANEQIDPDSDMKPTRFGPRPKSSSAVRFTEPQREHARTVVAQRVLQGYTHGEIAKELGISDSMVGLYLKELRQRWRASSLRDFDEARAIELAKIDNLEREYWESWERSKRPKTQTTQRTAPSKAGSTDVKITAGMTTQERDGDPRFLDGIFKCIERRMKLYGLDEAEKIAMVGAFSVTNDNDLSRRLARYNDALSGASIDVASATVISYRPGQSVDSERSPSETGDIFDVGGPDDGGATA